MEQRCLSCQSLQTRIFLQLNNEYTLYKCVNCGVVFTTPHPKQILELNKNKYDSLEDQESYTRIYPKIHNRAEKYIRKIKSYKKGGNYLDVGCSYGFYLECARGSGYKTYGVEISKIAANYAKKHLGLTVFCGDLSDAHFEGDMFDIVTLYDVLEHIPDITSFLNEIYRILKPKGLLVIQVPNIESYAAKLLKQQWNWLLVPQHLWHFSPNSLSWVLNKQGFTVEEIVTWDDYYDLATNLRSYWVNMISHSETVQKIFRKVTYPFIYLGIIIGSLSWTKFRKGGSLRIYATKR